MKASRFNEEQIIGILREQEAGAKTADVCRKHGISSATFYKWKSKYGGLDVSDARRLKTLEDENAKLKRLLAEADAGQRDAEGHRRKKMVTPAAKREAVAHACLDSLEREPAAGVPDDRSRSNLDPLPIVQAGRRGCPWPAAGAGRDPPALRLSTFASSASSARGCT